LPVHRKLIEGNILIPSLNKKKQESNESINNQLLKKNVKPNERVAKCSDM